MNDNREADRVLRILFAEDVLSDAELAQRELRKSGMKFTSRRVDTRGDFVKALEEFRPDVIVSDYSMPEFDGMQALRIASEHDSRIPFILLTGSMNEETAVACMRSGAWDYVIKEHTARLPFAVREVLAQAELRRAKAEAEAKTAQALEWQEAIFEGSRDAIIVSDMNSRLVSVNQAACRLTGFAKDELLRMQIPDLHEEEDLGAYREFHHRIMAGEEILTEAKVRRKDGTKVDVDFSNKKIIVEGIAYMHSTARDITDRKNAEHNLRLSETRFRSVWDNAADGMRLTDREGRIMDVNPAFCKLVKMSREELRGKLFSVIYQRHGMDDDLTLYRHRFDTGEVFADLVSPTALWNGDVVVVHVSSSFIETVAEQKLLLSLFRDVTQERQAEKRVEEERTLLRTIIDAIPDEIAVKDTAHRFLLANRASVRALGAHSMEDLLGKTDSDFMGPELAQMHLDEEQAILESGHSLINRERIRRSPRTGEIETCLLTTKVPVKDGGGKRIGVLVVNRYITERKRAEEALRASEEKFRSLFEESKDVIYVSTAAGRLLDINAAGIELFGYDTKEELLRIDLSRDGYVDPKNRERFQKEMEKAGFVKDFELSLKNKSGHTLTVLETATAVRDQQGRVTMHRGIIRDITRQKFLERQFLQAQKMESIGTLAGGIAHDFNNILGIVLGHLALLERTRQNDVQFEESIFSISKAVERGASLVRQILTFARKTDTQLEPVNINSALKELSKMLNETFPKTMTVTLNLDKRVPVISVDPTQLHQVLLNLCVNARDAMDGQGSLTLATQIVPGSDVSRRFPEASADHYLEVTVTDTGAGMGEETQRRIFEPFFTTKGEGRGTGLGLAVVYGILRAHHGFVGVESAAGAGTTFDLYFPVPEGILASVEATPETIEDLPGGTETILVVEDEEYLRDLLVKLLEMHGYRVIPASDGEEAVNRFNEQPDMIDLVLSDMGLPRRSGWEAVKAMRRRRENVRTILASGFLDPGQKSEVLKSGVKEFIQKPYKMEEVLKAIRQALDDVKEE